jgi:hypothetical protein
MDPGKRFRTLGALAGMAALGSIALPGSAHAWWRGGVGVGIWVPPVVVAPAPVYVPPPVYYAPPPVTYVPPPEAYAAPPPYPRPRAWIPPHWAGPYWVPGHWS